MSTKTLIAEGSSKLASVPSGGAVASGGAAPAAAAGGAAPAEEKKEEKKEEEKEESDDDMVGSEAKTLGLLVPCVKPDGRDAVKGGASSGDWDAGGGDAASWQVTAKQSRQKCLWAGKSHRTQEQSEKWIRDGFYIIGSRVLGRDRTRTRSIGNDLYGETGRSEGLKEGEEVRLVREWDRRHEE
ncbi:60s acidic ribosomal domain-containing protein [Rhizoctonia solani AG-1 IA]|uniref:60s acidic ribosomal domain-containing protein n=1 Tax=Thanatephorus cucumeris (strain AG1-IA) TaxID=983506 RepID=L8X335_THACA|nr:60s acidic ribosomal domain-containing protein [Rhizoctonia solani AG-1 IA]